MESFQRFRDWFWSERFWLPPPVTWSQLKSSEHARLPETKDLYYVVLLTFFIILVRKVFERFIALPLLKWCGLKERPVPKVEPNELLQKVYSNLTGQLEGNEVKSLASRLGWTVKGVEQWFRNKRSHSKPSKMAKSKETCWRCVFYTATCIYGVSILRKEKYLYDTKHFWIGYPNHEVSDGIYYYYVVQMAFYCGLLLSQFVDVKRKDFWVQTIHHVVTISLLFFSYSCNFVRIGAVILVTHDVSDILLEGAKVNKYLKLQKVCDIAFGAFAVVFFISRLVVYPVWILRSVWVEYPTVLTVMPMYYYFLGLLCTLQAMHIFWFYLIFRMAYGFLVNGEVDNDARSESEDSESDECKNGVAKNGQVNDKPKMQ